MGGNEIRGGGGKLEKVGTREIGKLEMVSPVVYVPCGRLATWPINHVAKFLNLKKKIK